MKVVCFVIHGVGEQNQKFSSPLKQGIQKQLQKLAGGREAVSKVEFRDLYWANEGNDFQDNLYRSVYPGLYSRSESWWESAQKLGPVRGLTFGLVGDVFKYLGRFQKPIKEAVLRQVGNVFQERQEAQEPFSLVLVGHSLGSVILHDLITGFVEYRYAAFESLTKSTSVFTMGSPIALFSLVADTADPTRFRKWTNFLHPNDPIAFPMAARFPKVADVELKKFSPNPLSSHGMYWAHPEVHKQIAREILDHIQQEAGVVLPAEDVRRGVPLELLHPSQGPSAKEGFSQYLPNFGKVPFEELFSARKQMDVCFLYGNTWVQHHAQYIAGALERAATDLRICLLSPESPLLAGLRQQLNAASEEDLRERIRKTTSALIEAFQLAAKNSTKPGRLRIYHSLNTISHSFYRFDDLMYFAPRQLTSDKLAATPIPTMVFRGAYPPKRKNQSGYDMYSWVMRDFETLLKGKRASLVFDSRK